MEGKNPKAEQRLHVNISGIVQGVGFRFFVYAHGQNLKLNGWVRNRVNGDVEVLAEGPRADLEVFLDNLKAGPQQAQVDHTEEEWSAPKGDLPPFTVLATDY